MAAIVHRASLTIAVAVEACARTGTTALEFAAEDVFGTAAELDVVSHDLG
jgi:hypothetical protein